MGEGNAGLARVSLELMGVCQWFLLCEREAELLVPHSILGAVPACSRCAERSKQ